MIRESRNDIIRCAIYTRKSTNEGLDQEFNTLDAQRESAEAFIASQQHEGWVCLPDYFDDGGFTGGKMERPALKRLLVDIEAGKVDCVVVYKVDRLSRSLLDFSRMMETFDKHNVSFVSVTQQFNTTSSMGRLTLNILLSFAQFEREIISERTRDKMSAARRKGKYVGGAPILGYDIDRSISRLLVNERESIRVRRIFELYLEHQSLLPTVKDLNQRNWLTKRWTTKKGKDRGGKTFHKTSLYALLTNVTYTGKIRYKDEIYEGEHTGIVDANIFEDVQQLLRRNHRTGGARVRNKYGALLRGLLHCDACNCAMTHSYTSKNGKKRYRYYVCVNAQKRGWDNCPSKSVPAAEIERFVIDQVCNIAREPKLISAPLDQIRQQAQTQLEILDAEYSVIKKDLALANAEMQAVVSTPHAAGSSRRQADLLDRVRVAEQRMTQIREETYQLRGEFVSEQDVTESLQQFDPVWESLSPREQARVLELLIERVEYNGSLGTISVNFRPTGFRAIAEELELEESVA